MRVRTYAVFHEDAICSKVVSVGPQHTVRKSGLDFSAGAKTANGRHSAVEL